MNLASNTAPPGINYAVEARPHPLVDGMLHPALHVLDRLGRCCAHTKLVQVLGHGAKLDDQVARKILWLSLATLLPPKAVKGGLVVTHDDPGVGAADEGASVL